MLQNAPLYAYLPAKDVARARADRQPACAATRPAGRGELTEPVPALTVLSPARLREATSASFAVGWR